MANEGIPCTKGASLLSDVRLIKARLGEAGYQKLLDELPVPHRVALVNVLPHHWVSIPAMAAQTRAAADKLGIAETAFAHELGANNAREHLNGVYRLFLRMGPADMLFKSTAQLWNNYYNRGKAEHAAGPDGVKIVRCSGLDCGEPAWCDRIHGYIEQGLTLAGHKLVEWRETQCAARGGDACEYRIRVA